MALDTPATIAVIGAGPIGLEAALYARFLGYDVLLLDKGRAADHVRQWGHVRMFSPFALNCSPLGLAALAAQDASYQPPPPEALLTGSQWVDCYLQPLAETDLLSDSLHERCEVLAVSRDKQLKGDAVGDPRRGEQPLRVLYVDADGTEQQQRVEIVIDASGVLSNPNRLGPGGAWALGERSLDSRIWRRLPDPLAADRPRYEGRRTLVVGAGYSAATTLRSLLELRRQSPATEILWATRDAGEPPFRRVPDDSLPARDKLAAEVNQAVEAGQLQRHGGVFVELLATEGANPAAPIRVVFDDQQTAVVDELVSHVGFHVDGRLFSELQVHQCYATEGPMKLAAALGASGADSAGGGDCTRQVSHGVDALRCPEPNFYLLGAKSYGRNSQFLVRVGLQQIKELFALIGGRDTLDLYAGFQGQPQ